MAIKFSDTKNEEVEIRKKDYFNAVEKQEDADVVQEKYTAYMTAFAASVKDDIMADAKESAMNMRDDKAVRMNRGQNVLTSEENKFFTNLVEDTADMDTYKDENILPESTVVRVFEDMQSERPLLAKINFKTTGIKTRMIVGDPSGAAMWGEIFGKIQGQIQSNFNEISFAQNKLTAFAIVPKDLLDFGPEYVERYVRAQLAEAIGLKLEEGIVTGNGSLQNQPVGLDKDMTKDDEGNITEVAKKTAAGELTFADAKTVAKELAGVMNELSTKENGKRINIAGKVTLAVNPAEQYLVQAEYTKQNVNGDWVTSLPFNLAIVASEFVAEGEVIAFVGDRYYAAYTGAVQIREYDQTLALEDANVYIAKQFAHGVPDDNKTALLYTLNMTPAVDPGV